MGYSSYLCKSCNHSIASNDCTPWDFQTNRRKPHWLTDCVLLTEGSTVQGSYDGFGHIVTECGIDCDVHDVGHGSPVLLHQACWIKMHRPGFAAFDGGSRHDPHQGNPPQEVWDLPSPLSRERYKWTKIATFGKRRYFRDDVSGRISQVGDSGATPFDSEDGILWVDGSGDRPVAWDKYGQIPVISEADGSKCWLGADTKDECMWVAKHCGIRHEGFQSYDWERVWKSPGPSSNAARVFFDRNSPQGKPRFAICDSSGGRPHTTEDGVMWIDPSRPIRFGTSGGFTIPVVSNSGSEYTVPVWYQTADFVAFKCGMEIVSECGKYRMNLETIKDEG